MRSRIALRSTSPICPSATLARQMAVDGREGGRVNPLLGDVGERDGHSGLSGDLGDAGAHLASADEATVSIARCHFFFQRTARAAFAIME